MNEQKKGADNAANMSNARGCNSRDHGIQANYIKLVKLCPTILLIAVIAFLIAYKYQAQDIMYISAGVMLAASIMEVALYPIEDEDEDENPK